MNDRQQYGMIVRAIKRQQKAGVKLVEDNFGVFMKPRISKAGCYIGEVAVFLKPKHPQACALGCLIAGKKFDVGIGDLWWVSSSVLQQQNTDFANGLTDGFDGSHCHADNTRRHKSGYRMGLKLRQQFKIK